MWSLPVELCVKSWYVKSRSAVCGSGGEAFSLKTPAMVPFLCSGTLPLNQ